MMEGSQSAQTQHDSFIWFTQSQLRCVIRNGIIPEWFHGIISRKMSEELLMAKPPGYFLIRVSESRIGFTLSYRAEDRCRHFMIDVLPDGHYNIAGENKRHRFLQDLVDFHRRNPIMPFSEVLTVACGQASQDQTDYAELLFPSRLPNPNTSRSLNVSPRPSMSQPTSPEEIPPALPYRSSDLMNSAVLPPDKLYPNIMEEILHVSPTFPAMPSTRQRYTADEPPSPPPPAIPARTSIPPWKQNQLCIRTACALERASSPPAHGHPLSKSSGKSQEAKPTVTSNLKSLKKKFQKKRSVSLEYTSTEGDESEYLEVAEQQPFAYTCTDVGLTNRRLPYEYLPPPPFAPGY